MILEVMLNSEKDAVDFVSKITAFPGTCRLKLWSLFS